MIETLGLKPVSTDLCWGGYPNTVEPHFHKAKPEACDVGDKKGTLFKPVEILSNLQIECGNSWQEQASSVRGERKQRYVIPGLQPTSYSYPRALSR